MKKKLTTILSVLVIVVFIAYIIFDTTRQSGVEESVAGKRISDSLPEKWRISDEMAVREGALKAVSVSPTRPAWIVVCSFWSSVATATWRPAGDTRSDETSNGTDTSASAEGDTVVMAAARARATNGSVTKRSRNAEEPR